MVDAFPFCRCQMFVRIAAVCYSLGSYITKQPSCLHVWVSIRACKLTCTACSSPRRSIRQLQQAHFRHSKVAHWSLQISLSMTSLDFVTFFTLELFALWPLTMVSLALWALLTRLQLEVKDWFLKIPGPRHLCEALRHRELSYQSLRQSNRQANAPSSAFLWIHTGLDFHNQFSVFVILRCFFCVCVLMKHYLMDLWALATPLSPRKSSKFDSYFK